MSHDPWTGGDVCLLHLDGSGEKGEVESRYVFSTIHLVSSEWTKRDKCDLQVGQLCCLYWWLWHGALPRTMSEREGSLSQALGDKGQRAVSKSLHTLKGTLYAGLSHRQGFSHWLFSNVVSFPGHLVKKLPSGCPSWSLCPQHCLESASALSTYIFSSFCFDISRNLKQNWRKCSVCFSAFMFKFPGR